MPNEIWILCNSFASGIAKLFDREILVHPRMTKVNAGRPAQDVAMGVVRMDVFTSLETEAEMS